MASEPEPSTSNPRRRRTIREFLRLVLIALGRDTPAYGGDQSVAPPKADNLDRSTQADSNSEDNDQVAGTSSHQVPRQRPKHTDPGTFPTQRESHESDRLSDEQRSPRRSPDG